jgi:hypothetical protein
LGLVEIVVAVSTRAIDLLSGWYGHSFAAVEEAQSFFGNLIWTKPTEQTWGPRNWILSLDLRLAISSTLLLRVPRFAKLISDLT